MRVVEPFVEVPVTTGSTYTAGGQIACSFDQVTTPGRGRHPCVRGLIIELSLGIEHDNVGAVSLPEEQPFRAIDVINLQSEGHTYIDLDEQAGWLAYIADWGICGRKPQRHGGGGAISLTNGVVNTVTFGIYIPFMLMGGEEADDINVSLHELLGAQLVMRWASAGLGGIYDAGADNVRLTAASTVKVFLDVIGREDELFRGGPKFTLRSWESPGVNERLPIVNERLMWLFEVPLHAANSIAANRITAAERTTFKLELDGDVPIDLVPVSYLSRHYNRIHPRTGDDMLVNHETDASPFLPLVFPRRRAYKVTHAPDVLKTNPRIRFAGTDTTPKLLWLSLAKYDDAAALKMIEHSGVTIPADELAAHISKKTKSKVDVGGDVADSLPFSVKKRPRVA